MRSRSALEVRRVVAGEGARLRALRLRAVGEAPAAFATSLELELARPGSSWSDLADASAEGSDRVVFVIADGPSWIAMVGAHWFDQPAGIAHLWGLWVAPAGRGRGLGRTLVDEVAAWASERRAVALRLGVIQRPGDAGSFYERLGFTRTGETRPLIADGAVTVADGAVTVVFLAKPL